MIKNIVVNFWVKKLEKSLFSMLFQLFFVEPYVLRKKAAPVSDIIFLEVS